MDWDTNTSWRPDRADPDTGPRCITLRCAECGRSHRLTRDQMAGYLELDWPECCGQPLGFFPGPLRGAKHPAG